MNWEKLLSARRIKSLLEGAESKPIEDHRSAFQQDWGRAIFSTPIRRLQDKTQVFPMDPNDSVRTRLTHSHEVATLAHDLALAVSPFLQEQGLSRRQVEDAREIARVCGLIHDLGNPPFGHAGEKAIASWFAKHTERLGISSSKPKGISAEVSGLHETLSGASLGSALEYAGDFLEFEGNAQTVRLIARLQIFAHKHGLNPTCATLSTACKYTRSSAQPKGDAHETKKIGYFYSEKEVIEQLREEVATGEARHPLTYLVEAADDIVYSAVDLEDGLRKGLYAWDTLWEWLAESAKSLHSEEALADVNLRMERLLQGVQLNEGSGWADDVRVQAFRTAVIAQSVQQAECCFRLRYRDIMNGEYHGELVADPEFSGLVAACKEVGGKHVYNSGETLRLEIRGREVIHDLLDLFWTADPGASPKTFEGKLWQLLSNNYRVVYKEQVDGKLPELYCRMQLLTDYLCGMTDNFAIQLHRQLKNGGAYFG